MSTRPLITIDRAEYICRGKPLLTGISIEIGCKRTHTVLGPNGSGKSLLARICAGVLEPSAGSVVYGDECRPEKIGCVSFELQKAVMKEERYNDDSQFLHGVLDPGRTVERFICTAPENPDDRNLEALIEQFGLSHIRSRGLRFLSSGEFRKMLIVRALASRPELLILDDPFDGLDTQSRQELASALEQSHGSISILIVTGREEDVPSWTDSVTVLSEGSVVFDGNREEGLSAFRALSSRELHARQWVRTKGAVRDPSAGEPVSPEEQTGRPQPEPVKPLIVMRNIRVCYYDVPILTDVSWTVTEGEHWRISGPNGSGKSTLLDLVFGDNPKAYGQNIELFGRRKGSGESVWDIKKRIGFVSGGFHMGYPESQRVLGVVVSGFHDSAGLYVEPSITEVEEAREWCGMLGLAEYLTVPFGDLSFGLQRLTLIVRAVIKHPDILILDEPCQGVDEALSGLILRGVEQIVRENCTTLLYVSHDPAHLVSGVRKTLQLVPHSGGGFTSRIED